MTTIKLHNSKTRRKEVFTPIDPENVRMYVCGPTVYDRAHIGNARPVIVFDTLFRLLRHVYGPDHVTYVRNFTDVDDKINARAAESGRSIGEITAETTQWYLEDMRDVGAMDPTEMPRATQYIPQMIQMIEKLIADGFAYAKDGHALFRVRSYKKYGALSGRSVDDMIAGARVEVAPYKEDPMDFVLWKPSTDDLPGWDSPWGRGRPGWHIECSAMAEDLLWAKPLAEGRLSEAAKKRPHTFDIHGGGNDLMFPHHENEVAQSCCASGHAEDGGGFANVWMHNEMLQVEGKKMSKSLGNFFTVRDLLDQGFEGTTIRFVFLSTHYRRPMDWTASKADAAQLKIHGYHATINRWKENIVPKPDKPSIEIVEALANDLNTHLALSHLDFVAKQANDHSILGQPEAVQQLANDLDFLGLWRPDIATGMSHWLPDLSSYSELLVTARELAMETKDFSEVDRLKALYVAAGVEVRMSKEGVQLIAGPSFDATKLEGL